MAASEDTVFFNGQFMPKSGVRISPDDRGWLFGEGVYEVAAVEGSVPLFWRRHLERLGRSAAALDLSPPPPDVLTGAVERLIEQNGVDQGRVYVQLTRGAPAERTHHFTEGPEGTVYVAAARHAPPHQQEGVHAIVLEDARWHGVGIKSTNLLANTIAATEAKRRGVYEAILVRDGLVTEATRSNVWCVVDGTILTRPADASILPGITRDIVLELARSEGMALQEKAFDLAALHAADEVFLTSTGYGIAPVLSVEGVSVGNGEPGPLARRLQVAYRTRVASEIARHTRR